MFCTKKPLTALRVHHLKEKAYTRKVKKLGLRKGDKIWLLESHRFASLKKPIWRLYPLYFTSVSGDTVYVKLTTSCNSWSFLNVKSFVIGFNNYKRACVLAKQAGVSVEEFISQLN
jgi:hypothetical protein